ncbi:MAG TPA: DUF1553 domain-containing protein [Planctomycetes bacterium]|nr:DUF1553 domain-containing protein [Planctomycetota bacterium]
MRNLFSLACVVIPVLVPSYLLGVEPATEYQKRVARSQPTATWSFSGNAKNYHHGLITDTTSPLAASPHGSIVRELPGPTAVRFPLFGKSNPSIFIESGGASLRYDDPGDMSCFDFGIEDAITIEAWVAPGTCPVGQQTYIIGKGRTGNPGTKTDNQNWALRLRNVDGLLRVSFLYRGRTKSAERFHRWNSNGGVLADSGWHHIVFTFRFDDVKSAVAYIDGRISSGTWDMGGNVAEPPFVDNDQVWIGSSMGQSASSTFRGGLDEIALYRRQLSADEVATHFESTQLPPPIAVDWDEVPADAVLVRTLAPLPDRSWATEAAVERSRFTLPAFGLSRLPKTYDKNGLIGTPPTTILARAATKCLFAAGPHRFIVRAKNATRLYVDGRLVAEQSFMSRNASGHESVPELPNSGDLPPVPAGHRQIEVTVELDAGLHQIRVDTIVGGKGLRSELGVLFVGWSSDDGPVQLLAPRSSVELDQAGWLTALHESESELREWERQRRLTGYANTDDYWNTRHARARRWLAARSTSTTDDTATTSVEKINRQLDASAELRTIPESLDDLEFLRRLALDTVGVVPSRKEIGEYLDQPAGRRRWAIDRYLSDPRWADHWVSYWQDVLAENPGILKPKLNNTGPFRWWIYESFLDNKAIDRFATELIMMGGGKYDGGPAGFEMATQNDVPMAAKAHVLSQAFLGIEMKCARCHDAPFHPFQHRDLFEVAAMLHKGKIKLPSTSSVPKRESGPQPAVESSLKPGDLVAPEWPFPELVSSDAALQWADDAADSRQRLASLITAPDNERFARVIANRLWHRYIGWGFVEPVDDWTNREISHPQILDMLASELVRNDYDLKQVAKLVFQSEIYQRHPADNGPDVDRARLNQPLRRRMSAEQLVDSLFVISGKSMDTEPLTLDPEGRRGSSTFLNLGLPNRGWHFTGLSNERDRPALALPVAQSVVDVLLAYGWRDARPNPMTIREETATVLQPMVLANGILGNRTCRLSDNSRLTELCHQVASPEELIEEVFLRVLSRRPTSAEAAPFVEFVTSGFEERRVSEFQYDPFVSVYHSAVSWSNHLSAEATRIKMELEQKARRGDPPTQSLADAWRERAEDIVWAILNSPEFVFVP